MQRPALLCQPADDLLTGGIIDIFRLHHAVDREAVHPVRGVVGIAVGVPVDAETGSQRIVRGGE